MRWTAILSERAKRELIDSHEWYEHKQIGLGDRFMKDAFTKLRNLEEDPTKGLRRNKLYYKAIVKTFPFLIIYRIEPDSKELFVQSIFHTRRNPKKKYNT